MKTISKLWIGIIVLAFLSPLGLIVTEYFKAGDAWGEWEIGTVKYLVGYIPKGLERFSGIWKALIPDYSFGGLGEKGIWLASAIYMLSAIIGIFVTTFIVLLIVRGLVKKR